MNKIYGVILLVFSSVLHGMSDDIGKKRTVSDTAVAAAAESAPAKLAQIALIIGAETGTLTQEQLKLLLDAGALLNGNDLEYGLGETPMMAAALSGHKDAVKILLDNGADGCTTALLYGTYAGHADVVTVALSHMKPINNDHDARFLSAALDDAIKSKNDAITQILVNHPLVQGYLVNHYPRKDEKLEDAITVLCVREMVRSSNLKSVSALLKNRADQWHAVLAAGAQAGHADSVMLALDCMTIKDNGDEKYLIAALQEAMDHKNFDLARVILNHKNMQKYIAQEYVKLDGELNDFVLTMWILEASLFGNADTAKKVLKKMSWEWRNVFKCAVRAEQCSVVEVALDYMKIRDARDENYVFNAMRDAIDAGNIALARTIAEHPKVLKCPSITKNKIYKDLCKKLVDSRPTCDSAATASSTDELVQSLDDSLAHLEEVFVPEYQE